MNNIVSDLTLVENSTSGLGAIPKHGFFPRELEDEAIYIMREVAAQFEKDRKSVV